METAQLASHGLTVPGLFKGLAIAFILSRLLVTSSTNGFSLSGLRSPSLRAGVLKTIGFFALFLAARVWLALVNKHVPQPYLVSICLPLFLHEPGTNRLAGRSLSHSPGPNVL